MHWEMLVHQQMDTYQLTPRQRDIAWGLLRGLSNREIGDGLGIQENTTKTILNTMYHKAEVGDRLQFTLRMLGVY